MRLILSIVLAIGSLSSVLSADDWRQWRGPHRDGVSQETGLLSEWPQAGPKLVWHVSDVDYGFSTPVVVGGRVYLLSNILIFNEFVQALDGRNGKRIWSRRLGNVGNPRQQPNYCGARSTPTVDGDALYALGSDGDLACLDNRSGAIRWQKNLRRAFGGKPGDWAYAESPLVDGNVVICTPGGKTATLLALNKRTGDVVWKSAVPGEDRAAYASVIIVTVGGVKQYVQILENNLVGIDAQTGKLLWRHVTKGNELNIPTPVARESRIFMVGGTLVELTLRQGSIEARAVYSRPNLPSGIGGAVQVNGYLYGTSSEGLQCVEFKSGLVKWRHRSLGPASVCYADGHLYVHGETGRIALVEARPDAYHETGQFSPPDQPVRGQGKAWPYPVVANGRLYIRDLGSLWCYDIQSRKAP